MTYIVPNYFQENNNPNLISSEDMFYVAYSSRKNQKRFIVRNTLNVIIIMFEGTKLLHMQNQDLQVEKNNIVFLSQGQYFMSEILGDTHSYDAALIYFDNNFIIDFIKKYDINMSKAKSKSEYQLLF